MCLLNQSFLLQTSASQLGELWRHAADFHLRAGDAATAAGSLLELHKLNPNDTTTLAQLITAYARVCVICLALVKLLMCVCSYRLVILQD